MSAGFAALAGALMIGKEKMTTMTFQYYIM